ncbi:MAG: FAD binding domain-containing protein [Pseudomonadales bacterium]|nr:FAD binding domain-containing protein [Pseudomonadales bacterium]
MGAYAYQAPTSVDEALSVLGSENAAGNRTQILAGGTDVMVQMRSIDKGARTFVDVKHVAEANALSIGDDEIFIGAAIASAELNENAELKGTLPGLIEAADLIGSTQIQGRATIGGNLCNSSPAGDTIPALIACGAVCVIASAGGNREVPTEDFVTGVGTNVLDPTEFLIGFRIPRPKGRSSDAYLRFIPRTEMDIAVCGAGVVRYLHGGQGVHRRRGDHGAGRARRRGRVGRHPGGRCRLDGGGGRFERAGEAHHGQARHRRVPQEGRRRPHQACGGHRPRPRPCTLAKARLQRS